MRLVRRVYAALSYMTTGRAPLPSVANIDPVNICNLKCTLCPTGTGKLGLPRARMSLQTFQTSVDKIPTLKKIFMYNWGEPFLNRDVVPMIRYAKSKGIEVQIDSNFSIPKPESFFRDLATSGLDTLRVSLDGASQETYGAYRRGGDFALVLKNIRALEDAKAASGTDRPKVVWKYIVNKHNFREIETARNMAASLGVGFETQLMGLADDLPGVEFEGDVSKRKAEWLPPDPAFVREDYRRPHGRQSATSRCGQLFGSTTINSDGQVLPCCFATKKGAILGDLKTQSFEAIWNGEGYRNARARFLPSLRPLRPQASLCDECHVYKKRTKFLSQAPSASQAVLEPST